MLLVSGATKSVDRSPASVARLYTPANGNVIQVDRPYAIDNGAFSGFDDVAFVRLLERAEPHADQCLWVAAPDVVGDSVATRELFDVWESLIRAYHLPVALVCQDGLTADAVPWARVDAVFIGGTTRYKLSPEAAGIVREAKRRGLLAHMGRVSSKRRARYAKSIGCDSIDTSGISRWPDAMLTRLLPITSEPTQIGLEIT